MNGPWPVRPPRADRTVNVDVLVIGAGPAGLALAADLGRFDVTCRVVDRRRHPEPGARCPNLWRRTLWALHIAGLDTSRLATEAMTMRRKVFHLGPRNAQVSLVDEGDPRFPAPWLVPQDVLEKAMHQLVADRGYRVDRGVTAAIVDQDEHAVTVDLRSAGSTETVRAGWVVAADGEDSASRDRVGIGWRTDRHPDVDWIQADVAAGGLEQGSDAEELFHGVGRHVGLVPLGGGRYRAFLARRRPALTEDPARVLAAALREIPGTPIEVHAVEHVWRRVPTRGAASRWREGRVLLLGESARSFAMPVHGLNTGIQDAVNLSWKLAAVVADGTSPHLLDSYESERRPVADTVHAKADLLLRAGIGTDPATTLAPILDGPGPRLRTEPDIAYGGPLSGSGAGAGRWAVTQALLPPGRPTVGEALRAGGWLLLQHAADGSGAADRTSLIARSGSAGPPVSFDVTSTTGLRGTGMCVRPDGYVLAEFGSTGSRRECHTLLHDIHRRGVSQRGTGGPTDTPPATNGSAT